VVFGVMSVVGVVGVAGARRFPRDPGAVPSTAPIHEDVDRSVDAAVVASGPHDEDDLS
jgi:hypothetical protein